MAQYIVNINKIDDFNAELKKQIDELELSINNLIKLKEALIWKSKVGTQMIFKYDQKIEELKVVKDILELFVSFLNEAKKEYSDGIEELKKKLEDVLNKIRKTVVKEDVINKDEL